MIYYRGAQPPFGISAQFGRKFFLGKMYDEGYISLKWIQPAHLSYNAMGTVDINLLIK